MCRFMSKQSMQLESPITIGTRKLAEVQSHQSRPAHPSPILVAAQQVPSQSLRQVAILGAIGVCIYVLSFTAWWAGYLGFFAIGPWAWMVIDARRITLKGYFVLYACGVCMWLMLRYLASADTAIDWQASELPLTLYLAGFVPAFVWLGRIGRETLRVPVPLWLPVVLVGLECLRTHLFGGFGVGVLGHATAYVKEIAQISDLIGSYGLSALMAS
jgi:apolipoprotein N-acyltransferase